MPRHREVVLLKNNIFLKSFSVKMGRGKGVKVFEQKKNMISVKQELGLFRNINQIIQYCLQIPGQTARQVLQLNLFIIFFN
jgi:hypothetical protein